MATKVAFITGAAKRLGAETARTLHEAGFNLIIHCHQSLDAGLALVDELNAKRNQSAALVSADLREHQQLAHLHQQVMAKYGRLDVLVNNASSFFPTPVGSISTDNWHDLVGTNMMAPLFLSQAFQQNLSESQGVIVNMCDIHADRPLKDHTLYCMAKAALVMMTKSLAKELAPNIRVNGIAPGAILWPENPLSDDDKADIIKDIPMARLGHASDIAKAIKYLVLDAPYVNGHILTVDGARHLGGNSKA